MIGFSISCEPATIPMINDTIHVYGIAITATDFLLHLSTGLQLVRHAAKGSTMPFDI